MSALTFYIYSTGACIALGLFELVVRLRQDRRTFDYDRLTWGGLFGFSVSAFIPVLNILILGWPMYSRIWDFMERLIEKWNKPIVTQERIK